MAKLKSGLYVLSLRDHRLQSTSGHCVHIPAQTPTRIPEALRYEAFALGCVECDEAGRIGDGPVVLGADPKPGLTLKDVLTQIYVDGEVENLDTQGIPKVAFVNELTGPDEPHANKEKIIRAWLLVSGEQGILEDEGLA